MAAVGAFFLCIGGGVDGRHRCDVVVWGMWGFEQCGGICRHVGEVERWREWANIGDALGEVGDCKQQLGDIYDMHVCGGVDFCGDVV